MSVFNVISSSCYEVLKLTTPTTCDIFYHLILFHIFLGHHFIPCECNSEASEDDTEVAGLCKNFYLNNDTKIYSLHDQIDHKLAFVYNFLPPESKLILIGHSVGAYIILEIMRRLQYTDRVIKGVLLFPTIERITKTSSGKFWTTVAYYMTKPVLWIIWLFNALPFKVQLSFVKCLVCFRRFCKDENLPGAILSFINHHGISNMFQIANDMVHIKDLDQETVIKDNEDKLVFYYGSEDPWVPVSFSDQMKERFQSLDVRLCAESYKHAFVLNSAKDVGKMTWSLIQDVLGIRK